MRQGNHSSAKWALAVAALVVLVSGGIAMGSNMGFKLNMPLDNANENVMSFPYLVPYADRQCLCDGLGLPDTTIVQQFDAQGGGFQFFQCNTAGTPCGSAASMDMTRAIWIQGGLVNPSAIVVGAHNPVQQVTLHCKRAVENRPQGDNWVSVPYHTTAVNTQDLCDEIGLVTGSITVISGGAAPTHFCGFPGEITLSKELAVAVRLDGDDTSGCVGTVLWTPSHF